MSKKTVYDFLELEFKELHKDINIFVENKEPKNIFKNLKSMLHHIVFYIYYKNKIYYDKNLSFFDDIYLLREVKLVDEEIQEKLFKTYKKVKVYDEIIDSGNDYESSKSLAEENFKTIYGIIIWLVMTYGEEDYSFLTQYLDDEEKGVLDKYIKKEESVEKVLKNIDYEEEEDVKIKGAKLVEEGEKYYFGKDREKNYNEALKYFLKSAEYGDDYGYAYIGLFYDKGYGVNQDYALAARWYYKAAKKGNSFAQNALGVLFANGHGVKKDYTAAMMWFQKSAESEYSPSYYQLGRLYHLGLGVEINPEKALYWYNKAAELNLAIAQYAVSFMYKNGEGCKADNIKAYYWIERAAENEYEDAYYIVGKSYLEGIVYDIDYEKAYKYLRKGYEALDFNCISALADMYLDGLYVEKNVEKALELYNMSIEYGSVDLYFKVGKIYENLGLIENALDMYNRGFEEEDLKCTQRLGIMYYNGEGVSRDLNKAIVYMQKAADKKAPHAMYVLGIAYLRLNKFKDKTEEIAKNLLKEAYKLKSPYAAEYLAFISINEYNEGKKIDAKELLEYINFAVENGVIDSIYQYGYIYEKGIAVSKDNEKAYYYYSLAAENQCIKAMVKLGEWYLRGIYVKQNVDLAIYWYEKAAEKNDIDAIEKLIEIFEFGIGNKDEDIRAIYYVFKLIDIDALKGKSKLAYYCFKGVGIEVDKVKGIEIIEEIEEIDKGTAYNLKGVIGSEELMEFKPREIVEFFLNGIECGNSQCYGNLAMYLYKNNLEDDDEYKQAFETALQGKNLGNNKCKYIYIRKKLDEILNTSIVSLEEIALINKLRELINNGFILAISTLINWYERRNMTKTIAYYKLKEQQYFYNLKD